ncbi:MAG: GNAT family N-acetyltransferase [Desulfovibrionaceae bacterium]
MSVELRHQCAEVPWAAVADILRRVGMAHHDPELHRRAFEASHTTVFAWDGDRLIGFGRAISDGAYQAAVYDCAVLPEYQGQRIGTRIMERILERVAGCSVILYAAPGKEGFYRKQGFRRMRTGMARFVHADAMRERGFTD